MLRYAKAKKVVMFVISCDNSTCWGEKESPIDS